MSRQMPSSAPPHALKVDVLVQSLLEERIQQHAIVFLDEQGRIVAWRGAAMRILGYAEDEVLGKPISIIFTPEDLALKQDEQELAVAVAEGTSEDDRWHVRKDGARIWAVGALTALRDAEGTLLGFAKLLSDRTDARAQVVTLTNRLQALEQQGQQQERFQARLSHEIRNTLAPLRSAVSLLRKDISGQSRDFTLGLLDRQLALLTRMAQDLCDGGLRPPSATLQLHRFDLGPFVRSCVDAAMEQAAQNSLDLLAHLPDGCVGVQADPERLQQVLYNLLDNAIKYSLPGGRVRVRLTVEDGEAVIRVSDNGHGIEAALLPKVFDELTRGKGAVADKPGSGLGLSIVRDLVQAHGGSIEARSEGAGKGSEFTVRLPLDRSH